MGLEFKQPVYILDSHEKQEGEEAKLIKNDSISLPDLDALETVAREKSSKSKTFRFINISIIRSN